MSKYSNDNHKIKCQNFRLTPNSPIPPPDLEPIVCICHGSLRHVNKKCPTHGGNDKRKNQSEFQINNKQTCLPEQLISECYQIRSCDSQITERALSKEPSISECYQIRHSEPQITEYCRALPKEPFVINCYIKSIYPHAGPIEGGTTATIYGNGFQFVKTLNFGRIQISKFNQIDNNKITFMVPSITTEKIAKTTVAGMNFVSNEVFYFYMTLPIITQLKPSTGPTIGGDLITIVGEHLESTQSIIVDGSDITKFYVIDNKTISFFVIPMTNTFGSNVFVKTFGGNSNQLNYTYVPPPMI